MSVPTRPAFVHYGTWDDETRAHPAMKWMEQYTLTYDSKAYDEIKNNLLTDDHLLVRTTGQKHQGAQASADAMYKEIYAPFAKWSHVPYHIIAYEVDDGWEMMGLATLYWTLAVPAKQESGDKVRDAEGNEWDGANPAAFNFRYRKVGDGIRLAKTEIAADRTAAVVGMLKRGMMKPEDLLK
ncbi:hypothetical protein BU25DRAFT_409129 [Macroventuria anomochaeta]|uniref:Uncharacterized protein n=1 Tax=Macroventuria anomochaeta TaxID=301207 RepID=A0ACB6S4V2_9PLEO|nr:uncharacterized protein BU25DRAFT_409129 [Macroventuria anomochaeta]KAF2629221.1 hypothetical protein BU25DRAFT_409129 [Macroventuria anomochaeta]